MVKKITGARYQDGKVEIFIVIENENGWLTHTVTITADNDNPMCLLKFV